MLKKTLVFFGFFSLAFLGLFFWLKVNFQKSSIGSFSFTHKKLILKNVAFSTSNFAFSAEKIKIPVFSFSHKTVIRPYLQIKTSKALKKNTSSFSLDKWIIEEGKIGLADGLDEQILFFSKDLNYASLGTDQLVLDQIKYCFKDKSLNIKEVPVAKLAGFARLWLNLKDLPFVENLEGIVSGTGFFDRKGEIAVDLRFKNLAFLEKQSLLHLKIAEMEVVVKKQKTSSDELELYGSFHHGQIAEEKSLKANGSFKYHKGELDFSLEEMQIADAVTNEIEKSLWLLEGSALLKEKNYHFILQKEKAQLAFQKRSNGKYALSVQKIGPEMTGMVQSFFQKIQPSVCQSWLENGCLSFYAEWLLEKEKGIKLKVIDLQGEGLQVSGFHRLNLQKLQGKGDFDFEKSEPINWMELHFEGSYQGNVLQHALDLQQGKCDIVVKDAIFEPSLFSFDLNGLKGNLQLVGAQKELKAALTGKGKVKGVLDLDDEISCSLTLKRRKEGALFSGLLQLKEKTEENQTLSFGLNLKGFDSLAFPKAVSSFWLKAEKLNLEKWHRFCLWRKDLQFAGKANLSCLYQEKEFNLDLQGENLAFTSPFFKVFLLKIGSTEDLFLKEYLSLTYDFKNEAFSVKAPILKGTFSFPEYDIALQSDQMQLKALDSVLQLEVERGILNDIELRGAFRFAFKERKWSIETQKAQGSLPALNSLLKGFGLRLEEEYLTGLKGSFTSQRGFFLEKGFDQKTAFWRLDLNFVDLGLQPHQYLQADHFQGRIIWDSLEEKLTLAQVEGEISAFRKTVVLRMPWLEKTKEKIVFDLKLDKGHLELASLVGSALLVQGRTGILLNEEKSHLFAQKLKVKNCYLEDLALKSCDLEISLPLKETSLYLGALLESAFFHQAQLSAEMSGQFSFRHEKQLDLNFKAKKVSCQGVSFKEFVFEAQKAPNGLEIKKCSLDDWSLDGLLVRNTGLEPFKLQGPGCLIEGRAFFQLEKTKLEGFFTSVKVSPEAGFFWQFLTNHTTNNSAELVGSGLFSLEFKEHLQLDCDLDLSRLTFDLFDCHLANAKPLNVHFNNVEGVQVKGLDFLINSDTYGLKDTLMQADFGLLDIRSKKWKMQKARIVFPSAVLEKIKNPFFTEFWRKCSSSLRLEEQLDLSLNLEGLYDFSFLKGETKELSLIINQEKRILKQICFQKNKDTCVCNFHLLIGQLFHPITARFCLGQPLLGSLAIGGGDKPLTFSFEASKEALKIQKIQGSYSGIAADFILSKEETLDSYVLLGSCQIDFSGALSWLLVDLQEYLEQMQLGSGFLLQGRLHLLKQEPKLMAFRGQFLGRNLEVAGYKLKSLSSTLAFEPGSVCVKDFVLSDMAGRLELKKMVLEKKENDWFFSVPYIGLFEFRPSLLTTIDEKEKKQTPLLIRNAEFIDLNGKIGDLKSIQAKGSLKFINSFKRGYNILEAPADVLGRIVGLDSELLIPVSGYLDLAIKDGRLSLVDLKEAYSENQRSKFFLIHPSFIDLKGDLNLHFKMKQYVLFKLTEKFVLSLKGTVSKPQLKLIKNKK